LQIFQEALAFPHDSTKLRLVGIEPSQHLKTGLSLYDERFLPILCPCEGRFVVAEPAFFADVFTEHRAAFTTLLRHKAIVVPGQLQLSFPEPNAAAEVPGIPGCTVSAMRDVVGPEVVTDSLRQIAVPGLLHVRLLVNRRQKLTALRDGRFGTT